MATSYPSIGFEGGAGGDPPHAWPAGAWPISAESAYRWVRYYAGDYPVYSGSWGIKSPGGGSLLGGDYGVPPGGGQSAFFEFPVDSHGYLQFVARVSSEAGDDFFRVWHNGVKLVERSGETGFEWFTLELPAAGTVRIEYVKGSGSGVNSDAAFIDEIAWHAVPVVEAPMNLTGSVHVTGTMTLTAPTVPVTPLLLTPASVRVSGVMELLSPANISLNPANIVVTGQAQPSLAAAVSLNPAAISVTGTATVATPDTIYQAAVVADTPWSYWRDGSGTDLMGHLNAPSAGAWSLVSSLIDTDPGASKATEFDAATSRDLGNGAYQVDAISIECWIKTTEAFGQKGILVKHSGFGFGAFSLWLRSGRIQAYDESGNNWRDPTGVQVNDGVRHHVVYTIDGTGLGRIYIDGALRGGTFAASVGYKGTSTYLGGDASGDYFPDTGVLDEVAVYLGVLSASRVRAHYAAATGTPYVECNPATPTVTATATVNTQARLALSPASISVSGSLAPQNLPQIRCSMGVGASAEYATVTALPLVIPDDDPAGVDINFAVPVGTVEDVSLSFYITMTYDGDLVMTLRHPDGTTISLTGANDGVPSSGDNFGSGTGSRTVLSDSGATSIRAGTAPYVGTFRPFEAMSAFNGKPAGGLWTLHIFDQAGGDEATVQAASLLVAGPGGVKVTGTMRMPQEVLMNPASVNVTGAPLELGGPRALALNPAQVGVSGDLWLRTPAAPRVTPAFTARFVSGQHIADSRVTLRAEVRSGRFERGYHFWPNVPGGPDYIGATIGQSDSGKPWQATWTPTSAYTNVDPVLEVALAKDTNSNGIGSATIQVENIAYPAIVGGGHEIRRGYLAPLRGYVATGRDQLQDEAGNPVVPNEWFGRLKKHAQITVFAGYGDEETEIFTGMVDDLDYTSRPDRITVTARDFGQVLTDERIFGWNKDPDILDPVTFIARDQADKLARSAQAWDASSHFDSDHGPSQGADGDSDSSWISEGHSAAGVTEWFEIELEQGRYTDFVLWPAFAGMDMWVSLYPTDWIDEDGEYQAPTRDGVEIASEDWAGGGSVPGDNGGRQFVSQTNGLSGSSQVRSLGGSYVVGQGTKLRVHFRSLAELSPGVFTAGVIEMHGRRRTLSDEAVAKKWILVDDVSDIVKVVLRWAGFKEWAVESTGVSLQKRLVIGRDQFYMDLIKKCMDATGYTFFMGDPTNHDQSIGVPTFRKTRAVVPQAELDALTAADPGTFPAQPVVSVTDALLLTAIQVRQTNEPLSYIIRVRGRESNDGQTLGSSPTKRVMFEYRPPWSGTVKHPNGTVTRVPANDELGGVIKHVVHTNPLFRTMDDCKFGAYYIALQQALASAVATIELPGYPLVDLDDHAEVEDLGTGLTTRLLVTSRNMTIRRGEAASWKMTLAGGLIDIPDVQHMVDTIQAAVGRP